MVDKKSDGDLCSSMDNGPLDPPLSYYQLRKRAATWLRCGTLSSLILTLAGVAMIILAIQGTPSSYNIKWIGIAASASGGSLLLLLLLISLIMASFCPQEGGGGSLQLQLQQGLPPPCPPSHHHHHLHHQHAMASGSGGLSPTSRHHGRASLDSMQWMVYYHPSKHQQLEHSILYPIPGFQHGMSTTANGVHNGAQWAWRAHHTSIQPPPQYSALFPDPNGNCIVPSTSSNGNCVVPLSSTNGNINNAASSPVGSNRGDSMVGTPTGADHVASTTTTPTERRPLQRPQRLTPPLLLRCSPSSERHVHHHHHHSLYQPGVRGASSSSSSPQSSQPCRTPTSHQQQSSATSPGQSSNHRRDVRSSPQDSSNPPLQRSSSVDRSNASGCNRSYSGHASSPSSQQVHLFHHEHPLQLPAKPNSALSGPTSLPSSTRRSYHSSLPPSPLLESVDESRLMSDRV